MQKALERTLFLYLYQQTVASTLMKPSIQEVLLQQVKQKVGDSDTLGKVLADVLNISMDAAYRRNRNETPLTIDEVQKLCATFGISFDALLQLKDNQVVFEYSPLNNYDFSLESYLEGLLSALQGLNKTTNPKIILTTNNLSLFQLLNFPHLTRFRLFFWAKTHLQVEEYKDKLFEHEKVTDNAFSIGYEILQRYTNLPKIECYDHEFFKGFFSSSNCSLMCSAYPGVN